MSGERDEAESTEKAPEASSDAPAEPVSIGDGRAVVTAPEASGAPEPSALAAEGGGSVDGEGSGTEGSALDGAVAGPVAPQAPVTTGATPVVVEAPVPSGPYRTPPYEAPLPVYGGRVMRPLLGPSLGTFGVLLWAYVVAGQLTTSWITGRPLGNGVAIAAVVVATFGAWVLGMRRSLAVAPASPSGVVGRGIGVGAVCLAMFFLTLVFAVFVGTTVSPGHDFRIAFGLVVVAFVAVVFGRRLVTPEAQERTHVERVVTVALWATCLLLTFVAGVDLAANG